MDPRKITVLLAVVVAASVVPTAMAAGFEISASDTASIPERTESFHGNTYTFDSMIRADEGDEVTVDVTAPDDGDTYRLDVRDSDRNSVESLSGEGSESFTLDLSGYEYGSYVVGVSRDGTYETIQPLLVSGYDVSVDAPASVSGNESVEATVDVTETAASSDPAEVAVLVAGSEDAHEVEASGSDGEYTASIDGGELDEGDYTVYAVAQGDEEAFGRNEILGLSDERALTVEGGNDSESDESDDGDSNESEDDPDGGESDGDDDADDGSNDGDSDEESDSSDDSDDSDDSADDGDGAANPPDNETESPTASPTETATETETVTETATDDGVVTPEETATETETTDSGATGLAGPGFTVTGALVAVALAVLLGRRRG